jgi:hypothetical protein
MSDYIAWITPLYKFFLNVIDGKDWYDILHRKEKKVIRKYVKNKDFRWLITYLSELKKKKKKKK